MDAIPDPSLVCQTEHPVAAWTGAAFIKETLYNYKRIDKDLIITHILV